MTTNRFLAGAYLPPELVEAAAKLNAGDTAGVTAEQVVLGEILRDPATLDKLDGRLLPEHFLVEAHRLIHRAALDLYQAAKPYDVVAVAEVLQADGKEERSGGLAYLGSLVSESPGPAALLTHAGVILDRFARRQVVAAVADGASCAAGADDLAGTLDKLAVQLDEIREPLRRRDGPAGLSDIRGVLEEAVDYMHKVMDGTAPPLLSTGWRDLDHQLGGGLGDGELVVIAGRSSMGKTALALGLALNVARGLGQNGAVAVFSLEMPRRELGYRLISTAGNVELARLRTPASLSEDDNSRIGAALGTLAGTSLQIDDAGAQTVSSIATACRRISRAQPLRLVVIDYLQLLTSSSSSDVREQQVAAMTRQLKQLARELTAPIVVLSQISRKVEERNDKRPLMSDLRESGAIEQDADVILMVYREEYYKPDTQDKDIAEVIVGKSRNGQRNVTARLRWRAEIQRFEDLGGQVYALPTRASTTPPSITTQGVSHGTPSWL